MEVKPGMGTEDQCTQTTEGVGGAGGDKRELNMVGVCRLPR